MCAIGVTMVLGGCDSATSEKAPPSTSNPASTSPDFKSIGEVKLKINIPDGEPLELNLSYSKKSSLFDVMKMAQEDEKLSFEFRGEGETVFVTSIQGIPNGGSSGPNWIYRINEKMGDCSAGVKTIEDGDSIEWSLGKGKPKFD